MQPIGDLLRQIADLLGDTILFVKSLVTVFEKRIMIIKLLPPKVDR
jgi:hypothetical protein